MHNQSSLIRVFQSVYLKIRTHFLVTAFPISFLFKMSHSLRLDKRGLSILSARGWMDGRMDGRMDGWMDGRTDGWVDDYNAMDLTIASVVP